jgi:hypothetical protein
VIVVFVVKVVGRTPAPVTVRTSVASSAVEPLPTILMRYAPEITVDVESKAVIAELLP